MPVSYEMLAEISLFEAGLKFARKVPFKVSSVGAPFELVIKK
jgi:hypothetical protein